MQVEYMSSNSTNIWSLDFTYRNKKNNTSHTDWS